MTRQLRAELVKVRSTRTTLGLLLGMVALTLLFTLLGGLLSPRDTLAESTNQYQVIASGGSSVLFSALLGIMLVTTEYRYGTIRPTFLYQPRRTIVVAAKLVAALVAGAVFGIVAEGLSLGLGLLILSARGVPHAFDNGALVQIGLGTVVVTAAWAALGVGLGAVVRHQVGAIVGMLAYLLVAENLLFGLLPHYGRYAPGPAGQAVAGGVQAHLVSAAGGAALTLAYVVALAAAGVAATNARDVD